MRQQSPTSQVAPPPHARPEGSVFVFGSNMAGVHGAGAARHAYEKEGAEWGTSGSVGRRGNSYAIPTKNWVLKTLPLDRIKLYVDDFITYARLNPETKYYVTRIGCGLAGYTDTDIAPMFKAAPSNCFLPDGWRE